MYLKCLFIHVRIDANLTTLWCGSLKFFICISDNMQRFSRMWHRTHCGRPKAQTDLKKLTDEMASEVQKVNSAKSRNSVMQSEPEALDLKSQHSLPSHYKPFAYSRVRDRKTQILEADLFWWSHGKG
jgi:hypothetical protein